MGWQQGGMIVGAVAVIYGLVVAFGLERVGPATRKVVVSAGALFLLGLAIVLFVIPLLRGV